MIKLLLGSIFYFYLMQPLLAQKKINIDVYPMEETKVVYHQKKGYLDGLYTSYHTNGNKRAEGLLKHNTRIGVWSVWDSLGNILIQREYENPFVYQRIIPKPYQDELIKLLDIPQYHPIYNKGGYIEWYDIHERMVFFEKRLWQKIGKENQLLFQRKRLLKVMEKAVYVDTLIKYEDDEFENEDTTRSLLDSKKLKISHFNIKEVFFFDTDRFVSERRILGIAPVVVDKITGDTTELYWIYYPAFRSYLAKERVNSRLIPDYINTLADVFFYRYFSSQILAKSNFERKSIEPFFSKKDRKTRSRKRALELIEIEHAFWVTFRKHEFEGKE